MNNYVLNENVYAKITNALEMHDAKTGVPEDTFYKSIYGPATLMNDWYEKRVESSTQATSPELLLSENMDKFRPHCKSSFPDRAEYFSKVFDGYGLGQELLVDHLGFSYYDNYTTSYDLMFNHLKKGICGPFPRYYAKGHYKPETNLTDIYGNLTQWGLKEKIYETMKYKNCEEGKPKSETFAEYVAHDLYTVKKLNNFQNFKKVKVIY